MNIWTILLSVLVFGLLVLFHELGHFLVARLFHIKVYEFSIGMGPKLIWYDSAKTGIRYKLCMIPFGGYVSFGDGQDDSAPSDDPAAFSNQKPWKRLLVLIAGGTVNLLLGFALMFAVTAGTDLASTVVADFPGELLAEGNVSTEEYGLCSGDVIVSVGKRNVHTAMELDYEIMRQGVEPVSVTVRRGEEIKTFTVAFPTEVTSGQVVGTR
ncbi:MAG: site-2 protease family protein, partial [Clostridia bacterium]|nr:site-2 protease family protein [Clostridia bacterium]